MWVFLHFLGVYFRNAHKIQLRIAIPCIFLYSKIQYTNYLYFLEDK